MSALIDDDGVAVPMRPQMPTDADARRCELTSARYAILTEQHDQVVDLWREQHLPNEVNDAWGPSDLSSNPLAEICRQLVTPGLYGKRPTVRHPDPATRPYLEDGGALDVLGYWTRMQWVQYLTLGQSEEVVVFGVDGGALTITTVQPYDVTVESHPDRPDVPLGLWWLRLQMHPHHHRWEYVWHVYELPTPTREQPSYRVMSADRKMDVSNLYLRTAAGDYRALEGDDYPFRYPDGKPFIPATVYRSKDTGATWNISLGRGIHHGTLNTALYYTYAGHCARAASGNMVLVFGGRPMGDVVTLADAPNRPGGARSMALLPGTLVFGEATDPGVAVQVHEIGPGGNLPDVSAFADNYALHQAVHFGLNPSDVTAQHANPTSGAALAISNSQKREQMAQCEPVFRRCDLEALGKMAALLRLFGGEQYANLPVSGYSISYQRIDDSPGEAEERRRQIDWNVQHGLMSEVDAFVALNPGASREDAFTALAEAAIDRAQLKDRIERSMNALSLGSQEAANASVALNGAQVTSALEIVQAVAGGLLPRESALAMLSLFFNLPESAADLVLGSVGRTFAPTIRQETP